MFSLKVVFIHVLLLLCVDNELVIVNKAQAAENSTFAFTLIYDTSQDSFFANIPSENVYFGPGSGNGTLHVWAYENSSSTGMINILRRTLSPVAGTSGQTLNFTNDEGTSISTTIPLADALNISVQAGPGYLAIAYVNQIDGQVYLAIASATSETSTPISISYSYGYSSYSNYTTGLMVFVENNGVSELYLFYDSNYTYDNSSHTWIVSVFPDNSSLAGEPSAQFSLNSQPNYSIPYFFGKFFSDNSDPHLLRKDGQVIGLCWDDCTFMKGDGVGYLHYPAGFFTLPVIGNPYQVLGISVFGLTVVDPSGTVSLIVYISPQNTFATTLSQYSAFNLTTCSCDTCCYIKQGFAYGNNNNQQLISVTFDYVQLNPTSNTITHTLATYNGSNITNPKTLLTTAFDGGSLDGSAELFMDTNNVTWFGYTTNSQGYLIRLNDYYPNDLSSDVLSASKIFIPFIVIVVCML